MRIIYCCILSALLFLHVGCTKKTSAGFGGNATLQLVAKHHGEVIDSITFYVKFNASDAPANDVYDTSQQGITTMPGVTSANIAGLKMGDYYIYAKGWDPSISSEVKGGMPYTITSEDAQDIVVAVTE